MSNFKVIETQEQLDAVISERIKRERENVEKKYTGYLSPEAVTEQYKDYLSPEAVNEKYKGYLSPEDVAKKDAKIKEYETDSMKTKVAIDMGIPLELKDRLKGTTEEEIREDAKAFSGYTQHRKVPLASTEPVYSKEDIEKAKLEEGYKKMVKKL